jgi:hypothetical protein
VAVSAGSLTLDLVSVFLKGGGSLDINAVGLCTLESS